MWLMLYIYLHISSNHLMWQGYVFTSVCDSVHIGVCGRPPWTNTPLGTYPMGRPPGRTPPGQASSWLDTPWAGTPELRWLLLRLVRNLPECILVINFGHITRNGSGFVLSCWLQQSTVADLREGEGVPCVPNFSQFHAVFTVYNVVAVR